MRQTLSRDDLLNSLWPALWLPSAGPSPQAGGLGFRGLGFKGLGFTGSGFKGLGFNGLVFRGLGFKG